MPIDPIRAVVILAGASALAACAAQNTSPYLGGPDNFGEANRQTFAAQVIDPDPVYEYAVPETHGEHAAQAVERYRTDKVKKPDRVETTDVGSEGGSKSGSGGSN